MTQQSIVKLFGDRWNPGMGSSFGEQLHENIRAALTELRMNQILLRRITAAYEAEKKPPTAPPPPPACELPDCLANSPAMTALHLAADGAICWPEKPTRAFISNIVAYLNAVADVDKADLCRRLGVVIKARRDTRCWPCKHGRPVDAVSLFFNKPLFEQLAAAAAKVK